MSILIASTLALLAPGAAAAPPPHPPQNPDRMICKRRPVTGSRTDFEKECRTAREWNAMRENHARGIREFTNSASSNGRPAITPGSE